MKFLSIVGARPQFIKLAPLSREIRKRHEEIILHTGQHYDHVMSDGIFEDLSIPKPDYNLSIGSGSHGRQTGRMLEKVEEVLMQETPDLVIIFGDTNSTLAGALAAAKLHIPSVHIEAGIRSFNKRMPEEINRIVADHSCDFLFVPTDNGMRNLEKEGLDQNAWKSGDIMVDTLLNGLEAAVQRDTLARAGVQPNKYYLMTLHRPYNVDNAENLQRILRKMADLSSVILFPAHPRTKHKIEDNDITIPDNMIVTEPFGYLDFLNLQSNAKKIITDSGGIQKEAYILEKPCITLRTETEWIETVDEGWNCLLASQDSDFIKKIKNFRQPNHHKDIFGRKVAKKMVDKMDRLLAV